MINELSLYNVIPLNRENLVFKSYILFMPIIKTKPPELLWHVTDAPLTKGNLLEPRKNWTAVGDEGQFVFATSSRSYCDAYAFKPYSIKGSLMDFDGTYVPVAIIVPPSNALDQDILHLAMAKPARLLTLATNSFEQVITRDGQPTSEWVSRTTVEIRETETIDGFKLMAEGQLQIFSVNPTWVQSQLTRGSHIDSEARGLFVDTETRKRLSSRYPQKLATAMRDGILIWENGRPEFAGTTSQPDFVKKLLMPNEHIAPARPSMLANAQTHTFG